MGSRMEMRVLGFFSLTSNVNRSPVLLQNFMDESQFQVKGFLGSEGMKCQRPSRRVDRSFKSCKNHQDFDALLRFLRKGASPRHFPVRGWPGLSSKIRCSRWEERGQNVLKQGMKDVFQLLIVHHGFRKIFLEFFEHLDLPFLQRCPRFAARPPPESDERYSVFLRGVFILM